MYAGIQDFRPGPLALPQAMVGSIHCHGDSMLARYKLNRGLGVVYSHGNP